MFAYDWRLSADTNAQRLGEYVKCVQKFHPDKKVNLLAHSMGGLIARRYILQQPNTHQINRLVSINTPWLGAPKAIHVLETGDFPRATPVVVRPWTLKRLAEFFPGMHQLLPSRQYYNVSQYYYEPDSENTTIPFTEHGWDIDGNGVDYENYAYEQQVSLMDRLHPHPQSLPGTTGKQFHDTPGMNDWTGDASGVEYHSIISTQARNNTIGEVQAQRDATCFDPKIGALYIRCSIFNALQPVMTLGDETVPLISLERGWSRGLQLRGNSTLHFFFSSDPNLDERYGHTTITELPDVHYRILYALGLKPAPPGGFTEIAPYGVASLLPDKSQVVHEQKALLKQENVDVFNTQGHMHGFDWWSSLSNNRLALDRPELLHTERLYVRRKGTNPQPILNLGGDWFSDRRNNRGSHIADNPQPPLAGNYSTLTSLQVKQENADVGNQGHTRGFDWGSDYLRHRSISDSTRFLHSGESRNRRQGVSPQSILNLGGDWLSDRRRHRGGGSTDNSQLPVFLKSAFSHSASNISSGGALPVMFDKAATEFKSHSQPRVVAVQQTGSPVYGEPRSPTQPSYYVTIKGIGFVSITDANGNTNTPIDGTFALKVPNVSYDLLGEKAVLISTPVNQTYTMTFQVGTSPVMVEVIKGLNNVTPTEVIRYRDKTLPAGTTAQLKITPEGVEDLRYDADGDGEFETTVAPTVKVEGSAASDVTPPVVSVNVTAQQGQAIVTLTVSDANSGVKSVYYSLDGTEFRPYTAPFQVDPAQTSIIYAFADDNLANRSSLVEKTFDFAPPVTTATALPQPVGGEWNTSDVTLTLRASEIAGASGVARITYTATGAQAVPETIVNANTTSLVITAEGVTTVTFFATDNAGNVEAAKTLTVKIAKSSPVISFAERVQGAGRQLTITAADTGAGVQTLEYSLDGAQFLPYTAPLIVDPTRNPTVYVRATGNLLNVVTYKPLMLTTSVTRDAAPREIIVTATIRNDSTAAVTTNFVLNGVKLNNKPTTSALPITINTLAAGESVVKTLRFPASAAKPNTRPTLAGSGTSHGQAFGGSVQIVVP